MSPRKPKTDQKRLPRKRRAKKPPRIQLTRRDVLLVQAVLKYRFLYIEQFQWLFPKDSARGILNRLRLLYHHGYLDRVNQPVSKSVNRMIYSLTEKGARLLAEEEGCTREEIPWSRHLSKITPTHINHLLTINAVMISYESALASAQAKRRVQSYKVIRGEPKRNRLTVTMRDADGRRREAAVVPDVILPVIFTGGEYGLFFLEVDRATMTTKRWQDKVAVYREYARSPELKKNWRANWFILLTVTTGVKRIDSLASATIQAGGKRGYWFTTLEQVEPGSAMGKLWTRASDLYDMRNEKLISLAKPSKTKMVSLSDALRRNHG